MKETIRDRIKSIANDPHIKERYDMYADMVLGDLREALLSEPVVEAAVKAVSSFDYEVDEIAFLPTHRDVAKAALQAALAAAKGTEDEQEDCGCTSIDYGWYGDDGGIVNDIQCSDEGCPRANKGTEGSA